MAINIPCQGRILKSNNFSPYFQIVTLEGHGKDILFIHTITHSFTHTHTQTHINSDIELFSYSQLVLFCFVVICVVFFFILFLICLLCKGKCFFVSFLAFKIIPLYPLFYQKYNEKKCVESG